MTQSDFIKIEEVTNFILYSIFQLLYCLTDTCNSKTFIKTYEEVKKNSSTLFGRLEIED